MPFFPHLLLPACVPIKLSASHRDRESGSAVSSISHQVRHQNTQTPNPAEQQKATKGPRTTSRTQSVHSASKGHQRACQLLHPALMDAFSQSPSVTGSLAFAITDKGIAEKGKKKKAVTLSSAPSARPGEGLEKKGGATPLSADM